MNKAQQSKRNFRNSKIWKLFRKKKMNDQKGLCFLSGRKLTGRWNLHHRLHSTKYAEEQYTDITNEENFICLNKTQHDLIHELVYGYTKYGRDEYLKKVFDEVLLEVQLNNL